MYEVVKYLQISQRSPVKGEIQAHESSLLTSEQVPPLKHGLSAHRSMSEAQKYGIRNKSVKWPE